MPDIPNTINGKKKCEVKVKFTVENREYMIHRGIAPGFLKLFEDYVEGDESDETKSKDDSAKKFTQKRIDELIGSNFNTFNHLLIMTNSYTAPFLDLRADQKREIIEDILGINIFGQMAETAKKESLDLKSESAVVEKEFQVSLASVNSLQNNVDKLKEKSEEFEANKKDRLNAIKEKLKSNKETVDTINETHVEEHTLTPTIDKLKGFLTKNQSQQKDLDIEVRVAEQNHKASKKTLKQLKDQPFCPICKTETSDEHVQEHMSQLESDIESSMNVIKTNEDKLNSLEKKETQIEEKIYELMNQIEESKKEIILLEKLQEEKERFKDEVKKIKSENNDFLELIDEDELEKKKEELIVLEKKVEETGIERQYYEYIRKLLSNDGIKNYVIKKILRYWNTKVNFYLTKLNAEFNIQFDENLDAVIKSRNRDPLMYHSFSGGEKARIDVAILLSVIDISKLQNSIDLNVMVIDELLDSGLDTTGREDVLNLFKEMSIKQNKSIYVISHSDNLPADVFNREITFYKKNGFTHL